MRFVFHVRFKHVLSPPTIEKYMHRLVAGIAQRGIKEYFDQPLLAYLMFTLMLSQLGVPMLAKDLFLRVKVEDNSRVEVI